MKTYPFGKEYVTTDDSDHFAKTPAGFAKEMDRERPLIAPRRCQGLSLSLIGRRESFSTSLTRDKLLMDFYDYYDEAHARILIPETIREIYNEWMNDNVHLDTTLIVVKYVINNHFAKGWDKEASKLIDRTPCNARGIMTQFIQRVQFRLRRKTQIFPYNTKYIEDFIKSIPGPIIF